MPAEPNYPELSDREIERRAESLLADYASDIGEKVPVPTPVEVIAEQFLGYEIDFREDGLFSDPDYLGGIVFDKRVIQINAAVEDHEGRYNFTIAHEIGHHVLHRDIYLAAREGAECEIVCRDTFEKPLIEQQADRFAAALLMPAEAVINVVDGLRLKRARSASALRTMAHTVMKQGGFTNVSLTAMMNRLIDLNCAAGVLYQSSGAVRGGRVTHPLYIRFPLLKKLYARFR